MRPTRNCSITRLGKRLTQCTAGMHSSHSAFSACRAKGQLVNEAWAAKDYTRLDTIKPDGTYQVGEDGFMEFYPEAASLQQAVLQLFYEKVE